jgi:hypothetical protein
VSREFFIFLFYSFMILQKIVLNKNMKKMILNCRLKWR